MHTQDSLNRTNDIHTITVDGNEAVARVAYRTHDTIIIYPITPSSNMGEWADEWAAKQKLNLWGDVPDVVEMQSEAGAIGAVHGALQAGALATTFTASQGLLLMIPNLYKIAGELTPFCMHVAARTVASHALSIFGDHSDVMACRSTGMAMLCSANVQEAQDMALIAQTATLKSRIPFMHFFDGFRTSHEVAKIVPLDDDDIRAMMHEKDIEAHRLRALRPESPVVRGTAHNPDTWFQAREASNRFYNDCPQIVQQAMNQFAMLTGRQYNLFDYAGHPNAHDVIIIMGSGSETTRETIQYLNKQNQKLGVLTVRLYRPFDINAFINTLPKSVQRIAVLDRTKEPGAIGEPLYEDVITALRETNRQATVIGGRYGLSSKEFTPAMVKAIFDNLAMPTPMNHFTVGIEDDVTHHSLDIDEDFDIEPDDVTRCVFFGLGSDGTVGANKNAIKIIGESTDNYTQGYFVYDSKKSGTMTVSHLRFGRRPIQSAYLVRKAQFVACHQFPLLMRPELLDVADTNATLLLNAPHDPQTLWTKLPPWVRRLIVDRKLKVYTIHADAVAAEAGLPRRINVVMQTCFFALSGVLPRDEAIDAIKQAIRKTYARKGDAVVDRNIAAVDVTLANLHEMPMGEMDADEAVIHANNNMPEFVKRVTLPLLQGRGDRLPVSAFPVDGTWPTGTTRFEKRMIAHEVPEWEPDLCIQCNKCAIICPHAAIRAKVYEPDALASAPDTWRHNTYKAPDFKGQAFTIQVAPEDCTGCNLCIDVCPVTDKQNPQRKALNMLPILDCLDDQKTRYDYFQHLPNVPRSAIGRLDAKGSQLLQPLFEFSGACSGCGETPYIKLVTQLFGDRLMIANATGCSSIYGGNLPTTPYTTNDQGRGPAWCNSLFEDNAEFGFGIRIGVDHRKQTMRTLLKALSPNVDPQLVNEILACDEPDEVSIHEQRLRVQQLKARLRIHLAAKPNDQAARTLLHHADELTRKSIWLIGGDGWAYDIGYGGLDHVFANDRDVNVLVLDTQVYSNTGGQASKATPLGATARFAAAGKPVDRKDLAWMAMSYGHVYVGTIALGANDNHAVKTMLEAESYRGPSLILAYSPCLAHGYDMGQSLHRQKAAVDCGLWPLMRFDPRRVEQGKPALTLDSKYDTSKLTDFMRAEQRFLAVEQQDPQRFEMLSQLAQTYTQRRLDRYQHMTTLQSN